MRGWAKASVTYCKSGVGTELTRKRQEEADHLSSYLMYPVATTHPSTLNTGMESRLYSSAIANENYIQKYFAPKYEDSNISF